MSRLAVHLLNLIKVGVRLAAVASILAFGARGHWLLDILVNFRVQYALYLVVAVVFLLLCRSYRWAGFTAAVAALNLWFIFPYLTASPQAANHGKELGESFRLLNFNVLSSNQAHEEVIDYLRDQDADFVFVLEVSPDWEQYLEKMKDLYPYQKREIQSGNFGIALLSKTPFERVQVTEYTPAVASIDAYVLLGSKRVRLVCTHPYPPINGEVSQLRNNHMKKLAESVVQEPVTTKTIVAGDFNMTPWSPHFRDFLAKSKLEDSAKISAKGSGVQPTWYVLPSFCFGIPIDYICTSEGIQVDSRGVGPDLGSDHRAVWVDFRVADEGAN